LQAVRELRSIEVTNKLLLEQDVNFYSRTIKWCKHRVRRGATSLAAHKVRIGS